MEQFINWGILDLVDIVCVALMLYYLYRVMRTSRALNIFIGIMIFVLVWIVVSQILGMRVMGSILDKMVSVGLIAIVVIFQSEIRRFFYNIGASQSGLKRFFSRSQTQIDNEKKEMIMAVVMACMSMSRQKVGALIVFERSVHLEDAVTSGEKIDAIVNQRLIENIFFKNSPLHDGAMVISEGRIEAASCILPVSHNTNIPKNYGLRHRSGLGITEGTDAVAIIVSEETGGIAVALDGAFQEKLTAEALESLLDKELK